MKGGQLGSGLNQTERRLDPPAPNLSLDALEQRLIRPPSAHRARLGGRRSKSPPRPT
jgi:hypothetical protein